MLIISALFLAIVSHNIIDGSQPNILLLFPDEWRFDWSDNYYIPDLNINTTIFNMVQSSGVRFVNTLVASPVCACSRAALASGKEYDYAGVKTNMEDYPMDQNTFYKLLQLNGYYTMITGKDDLTKKTGVGVDGSYRAKELGFSAQRRCLDKEALPVFWPNVTDPFESYLYNESLYNITNECYDDCCNTNFSPYQCPNAIQVPPEAYQDNWITSNSLELLDKKPSNKPWFMQINFAGPHPPFFILQEMNETVNNRSFPAAMNTAFDANDMQTVRRDYTAEVENIDTAMGTIIDKVKSLGEFKNTVICISSDHGEMLGDYSTWQKSKPWIASTNVPLVCMGPNIKQHIIKKYVTILDLAGTFLDYADVEIDWSLNMTTRSLRPFLNGTWTDDSNEYRSYVNSGLDPWRLTVEQINTTVTWKFVCCDGECPGRSFVNATEKGKTRLLFNLIDDPYETTNVAQQYNDVVQRMIQYLPECFCCT